jgi:hypothetical protein
VLLLDAHGLAGQELRHLLRVVARLGTQRRDLACERMFA